MFNTSLLNPNVSTGTITIGGSNVPTGYLLCDGAAISRTLYATLFSVIGTTYGAGDGSTTFNLPNLNEPLPLGTQAPVVSDYYISGANPATGAELYFQLWPRINDFPNRDTTPCYGGFCIDGHPSGGSGDVTWNKGRSEPFPRGYSGTYRQGLFVSGQSVAYVDLSKANSAQTIKFYIKY